MPGGRLWRAAPAPRLAPVDPLPGHGRAIRYGYVRDRWPLSSLQYVYADGSRRVRAGQGRTDLVLGPDRRARAVDGLVTGLHAPEASHLRLLEAVERRYLWHEFGDSMLLLREHLSKV